MKTYKIGICLTLFFFVFTFHETNAQFFFGASVGNSFVNKKISDINGDDFKINENSFGYKIYGGFGGRFIGAEGGYRDLGTVKSESDGVTLKSRINGWDIAARGNVNIGPVFISAKAGGFFAKADNSVGSISYTQNNTNFLWGLGAGVRIGMLGLRVEYESLDMSSDSKLAMLTLGASIHLGHRRK